MAIQVNGTTVINNSRQLSNIASFDSTTTTSLETLFPSKTIQMTTPSNIVIGNNRVQSNSELIFRSNSLSSGSGGVSLSVEAFNMPQGASGAGGGFLGTAILYNIIYDNTTYLWQSTSSALGYAADRYLNSLTKNEVLQFGKFTVPANKNYQWEIRGWNYTSSSYGGYFTINAGGIASISIAAGSSIGGTFGS